MELTTKRTFLFSGTTSDRDLVRGPVGVHEIVGPRVAPVVVAELPVPLERGDRDRGVRSLPEVGDIGLGDRGVVEEHRDDQERDDRVERLDRQVVLRLPGQLGAPPPVRDADPEDQAPDEHADDQRGDRGPGPQHPHPLGLLGDAARPAEAQVVLDLGARAGRQRQHDQQRARGQPRDPTGTTATHVPPSPADRCELLVRPAFPNTRRLPARPGPSLPGSVRRAARKPPPARRVPGPVRAVDHVRAPAGSTRRPTGRAARPPARKVIVDHLCAAGGGGGRGRTVAAWPAPTSTPPRRRRCTRWPGRRCWPRWTTAGPTRPGSTARAGAPGCCSTAPARPWPRCSAVRPDEVTFCASGTQAAQLAVLGGLAGRRRAGSRLVHSAVEHSCVLHAAERHVAAGGEAVGVPVDRLGRVDPAAFAAAVAAPGTALASLMSANHEVGTVQPVAEVAAACAAGRRPAAHRRRAVARPGAGAGRLVAAVGQRAQVGRPARRRRAGGPHRHPVGLAAAHRRAGARADPRLRERAGRRRRRGLAARPGGGGRRGGRPPVGRWSTGSGRPWRRRSPTWRWSATRPAGCRTWSPSPASTSTARRCCTSWTGAASPCPAARPAPPPR